MRNYLFNFLVVLKKVCSLVFPHSAQSDRHPELDVESPAVTVETLKQVQGDEFKKGDGHTVEPSLRAFEKCVSNYCLNKDSSKIPYICIFLF